MRWFGVVAPLAILVACFAVGQAQPHAQTNHHELVGNHPSAIAMARALDQRLTIGVSPEGRVVHVQHCRTSQVGCRTRIAALSKVITDVSNVHGIDPFLTAAIAIRETRLNPMAIGPVGERGIVQLHPEYIGRTVPFVYDDDYRNSCLSHPEACQSEVLDAGLGLFRWAVNKCRRVEEGLGWYNSGHCIKNIYTRGVLRERRRLLRLAKRALPAPQSLFVRHASL